MVPNYSKFIKLSNKNKMRHWIEAARRTLPSVSGIIVGSMYALAINGLYRGQLENI
jgi:hypothetical protein